MVSCAYRYLLRSKDAGIGICVLPYVSSLVDFTGSLLRFAKDHGLKVEYFRLYHGHMWDQTMKRDNGLGMSFHLFGRLIELVSFRRIAAEITDFVIVLRQTSP